MQQVPNSIGECSVVRLPTTAEVPELPMADDPGAVAAIILDQLARQNPGGGLTATSQVSPDHR
jgi:hypothetical protein